MNKLAHLLKLSDRFSGYWTAQKIQLLWCNKKRKSGLCASSGDDAIIFESALAKKNQHPGSGQLLCHPSVICQVPTALHDRSISHSSCFWKSSLETVGLIHIQQQLEIGMVLLIYLLDPDSAGQHQTKGILHGENEEVQNAWWNWTSFQYICIHRLGLYLLTYIYIYFIKWVIIYVKHILTIKS